YFFLFFFRSWRSINVRPVVPTSASHRYLRKLLHVEASSIISRKTFLPHRPTGCLHSLFRALNLSARKGKKTNEGVDNHSPTTRKGTHRHGIESQNPQNHKPAPRTGRSPTATNHRSGRNP